MPSPPLAGKLALAARTYRAFATVALRVHRDALPDLVARLSRRPNTLRAYAPPPRIVRAAHRCLTFGRLSPRCITKSLVVYRVLVEQGETPQLVIGLLPDAVDHRAHAWVELAGSDIGPPPGRGDHAAIGRFP